MSEERIHLGRMHIVRNPCGHVVAACWVDGNAKDAASFKRLHKKEGREVQTLDRHSTDPMPEWCNRNCEGWPS
jgi:hypothetical protein